MDPKAEVLWRMCNEHYTQARHHETQRSTMSQIILAVAAALVGFSGSTAASPQGRWAVALFIVLVGLFGALFSMKQYERSRFHMTAAGLHRRQLEKEIGLDLSTLRRAAVDRQKERHPRTEPWSLHVFWTGIHILIAGLGLVLLLAAVFTRELR